MAAFYSYLGGTLQAWYFLQHELLCVCSEWATSQRTRCRPRTTTKRGWKLRWSVYSAGGKCVSRYATTAMPELRALNTSRTRRRQLGPCHLPSTTLQGYAFSPLRWHDLYRYLAVQSGASPCTTPYRMGPPSSSPPLHEQDHNWSCASVCIQWTLHSQRPGTRVATR
jgi:hypothetical protein